jgi:hypothetical protein
MLALVHRYMRRDSYDEEWRSAVRQLMRVVRWAEGDKVDEKRLYAGKIHLESCNESFEHGEDVANHDMGNVAQAKDLFPVYLELRPDVATALDRICVTSGGRSWRALLIEHGMSAFTLSPTCTAVFLGVFCPLTLVCVCPQRSNPVPSRNHSTWLVRCCVETDARFEFGHCIA